MNETPIIQCTPMHDSTPLLYPETAHTFTVEVCDEKRAKEFADTHGQTDIAFMTVTKIINILRNEHNISVIGSGSDTFTIDLARIPTAQGEPPQKVWERLVKENFLPKKTGFILKEAGAKKAS